MAPHHNDVDPQRARSNRVVAAACLASFVGMVGMAYAAVPLYDMFCRMTGFGGTTQRVTQYSDTVLDRTIKVRFDANTSGGLGWQFAPVEREVTLRIGETAQVAYKAHNVQSRPTAGRATFNVTPEMAGAYFNKVECFCFTDTTLQPGETMDMPVVFYVDPEIVNQPELAKLTTITLSYTFFPIETPVAVAPGEGSDTTTKTDTTRIGG